MLNYLISLAKRDGRASLDACRRVKTIRSDTSKGQAPPDPVRVLLGFRVTQMLAKHKATDDASGTAAVLSARSNAAFRFLSY